MTDDPVAIDTGPVWPRSWWTGPTTTIPASVSRTSSGAGGRWCRPAPSARRGSGRCPARGPSTSACSSATSPSTSSGWARPPWPARWSSGSTRPAGARRWPATSCAPTAGWWSPTPTVPACSTASTCRVPHDRVIRVDDAGVPRPVGPARGRRCPGRGGRVRTRPGGPLPPAVHLGHHRRAQGRPLHPGPPVVDRSAVGRVLRLRPRRRGLLHHAPVPRQRADGPVGTVAGGGGHRGPGPPIQRLGLRGRRPQVRGHHLHLRGQGPGLRAGHPAVARRRLGHPPARVRHRGVRGRPRRIRTTVRLCPDRGVRLQRGGDGHHPDTGHPGRLARPAGGGHRHRRPGDGGGVPAGPVRHRRPVGQRRRGHRRDRQPGRHRRVRGLLRRRGGHRLPDPGRLVLERGPGLPRRGRLLLLRRAAG